MIKKSGNKLKYYLEISKLKIMIPVSLTDIFTMTQINRLTFTWVISSVVAALFLCYFEIIRNGSVIWILLIASALMIWQFFDLIKFQANKTNYKKYSILLDSYFLLVLLLLIIDRIMT